MKKVLCTILFACCFLIIAGCSQDGAGEISDRRPMIMVEDGIYMDTGKQIAIEIDDSAILGSITSSIDAREIPTQNGESNFGSEGAPYAFYDDGLVVMLQNEWFFFEKEKGYTKDKLQEDPRQSTGAGNETAIAAKEEYDAAVSAYEALLQGDADAEDPKCDLSESGSFNINDLSLGPNTLHALFDMNGDGIPELHLRPTTGGGYEIFTYRDGQVVLWHVDVDYCSPLNNGALLYERPGGAPPHTNYMYITLDSNGNEISRVGFAEYDVVDENDLKVGVRYIYEDNDVSKETWDALTDKFLSIKSDLIEWIAY
jgi:hypothetical protein